MDADHRDHMRYRDQNFTISTKRLTQQSESHAGDPMTTDIAELVAHHFPGIVIQRTLADAIAAWLIEHGAVTDDDVPAILALANAIVDGQDVPPYREDHAGRLPVVADTLSGRPAALPRFQFGVRRLVDREGRRRVGTSPEAAVKVEAPLATPPTSREAGSRTARCLLIFSRRGNALLTWRPLSV